MSFLERVRRQQWRQNLLAFSQSEAEAVAFAHGNEGGSRFWVLIDRSVLYRLTEQRSHSGWPDYCDSGASDDYYGRAKTRHREVAWRG